MPYTLHRRSNSTTYSKSAIHTFSYTPHFVAAPPWHRPRRCLSPRTLDVQRLRRCPSRFRCSPAAAHTIRCDPVAARPLAAPLRVTLNIEGLQLLLLLPSLDCHAVPLHFSPNTYCSWGCGLFAAVAARLIPARRESAGIRHLPGALTITVWAPPTGSSNRLMAEWIFPIESRQDSDWESILPPALEDDPTIPPYSLARITVADCVGLAMLLEGCPGLPLALHASPFQLFDVIWVEERIDPTLKKAKSLTREDLAHTLENFGNFWSSGIWLVPKKKPSGLGPVSVFIEKYFKSAKERGKAEDKREDAFSKAVMARGKRRCQITGERVSVQAAHLIPLAMGTSVLALIVQALNKICNDARDFINTRAAVAQDTTVFADIREPFPFDNTTASINDDLNGWVIETGRHDAQDRHRRWTRNPATNHLIWLCNPTSGSSVAKMSFGYRTEGLQSKYSELPPEDPCAIFGSNTEGRPVVQQPRRSFMLHCISMLLVFAHRYLSKSKRERLKAVAKTLARKLTVESSGGRVGDGAGRGDGDGAGEGTGDGAGDGAGDSAGDGAGDGAGDSAGDGAGDGNREYRQGSDRGAASQEERTAGGTGGWTTGRYGFAVKDDKQTATIAHKGTTGDVDFKRPWDNVTSTAEDEGSPRKKIRLLQEHIVVVSCWMKTTRTVAVRMRP
ncbi:hypothetical protein GGX14DRAFT_398309 [Mycena pura]|uniref:Uncharacterized protein n=1 Tax=Mycena pura TaxID=153505 RepID=A0AAD6V6V5_9AGAR|nr:hypothetical protein GGX14DRAFT_398309 [Mycena pura]